MPARNPISAALALGALFALLPTGAAHAAACGVGQTPLLDVVLTTTAVVPRPPYPAQIGQTVAFVYRSNQAAVSRLGTVQTDGITTDGAATLLCGTGASAPWTALNAKLAALQPGFAKSCNVTDSAPFGVRLTAVWHGKGARKNGFVFDSANDALPACSPQVSDFLNALVAYLSAITPVDTFGKLP